MAVGSALGFGVFLLASTVVGLRLLALALRTRGRPELWIALAVLGIGPAGFGLLVAGRGLAEVRPGLGALLFAAGSLASAGGTVATLVFNAQVFRPGRAGARAAVALATTVLVAALGAELLLGGGPDPLRPGGAMQLRSAVMIAAMLWGAAESLRYYALMRRRAALGLAAPLVTNRFLLWGLGIGAAGLGAALSLAAQAALGADALDVPAVMLSNSLHGLVAAVCMWLAFLPPAAYRRLVERRAPAAGGAAASA